MRDVRISVIEKRLWDVKKIIGITGGKGGIGKSSISSMLALSLSKKGKRTGLVDLDLSGPSIHNILGIRSAKIEEDKGLLPPSFKGISFMSPVLFSKEEPLPLRGIDITNAIIEIFSSTLWGELDFLIIDMPPGTTDAILDIIRLIKRIEFLIVLTPSPLAFDIVRKHIIFLSKAKARILGIIENMKTDESSLTERINPSIPSLISILFEKDFEEALGDEEKLIRTEFFKRIDSLSSKLISLRDMF